MSIIRRRHTRAFATIPNAVANDERLGFAERGLLVYLLAKPEGWSINVEDLRKQGGIGRDATYGLLRRLIEAGYVSRTCVKDAKTGRVAGTSYEVFDLAGPRPEKPEVGPLPGLPDTGEPDTENQDAYKRHNSIKTDYLSSASAPERDPTSELEDVLDEDHAAALVAHFAGLGKPLTGYTAHLKAQQLEQFPDPNAAADELIANGWSNMRPGWGAETHRSDTGADKEPVSTKPFVMLDPVLDGEVIQFIDGELLGTRRPLPVKPKAYTLTIVERARAEIARRGATAPMRGRVESPQGRGAGTGPAPSG